MIFGFVWTSGVYTVYPQFMIFMVILNQEIHDDPSDPPWWGDHHGWQRGDQRDDGGTDFLWCRCHQGLEAHPKSCKAIAAIAPKIDVEQAKMRGYILASFFFSSGF